MYFLYLRDNKVLILHTFNCNNKEASMKEQKAALKDFTRWEFSWAQSEIFLDEVDPAVNSTTSLVCLMMTSELSHPSTACLEHFKAALHP